MKKTRLKFPAKTILISLLCLAAIFLPLFFSIRYLKTADYFRIKDSDYLTQLDKGMQQDKRHYLIGFTRRNIFEVNLQKEARRLTHIYPEYKKITLRRLLPDRIIIDFIPRQALAILELSDNFYVDEGGVLFRPSTVAQDETLSGIEGFRRLAVVGENNPELPLIIGLETRIVHPRSGVKYNEQSLQATIDFINNLNKDSTLSEQIKIKEINLINVNDVFLFTTTDCKINLGGVGSLNKKLSILQRLFSDIEPDFTTIEYIDLRFREPVVKYR